MSQKQALISPCTNLSLRRQCELLGVARSAYYYPPVGESPENLPLMRLIDELYPAYPFFGARRMLTHLPTEWQWVNIKPIGRLMGLMGIEALYPKPNLSKAAQGHKIYPYLLRDRPVTAPNQVWATDSTYIPMAKGFLYLTAMIDWYSRFVLSWRLSNSLHLDFCVACLKDALSQWGTPQIFNTYQGSQFTSDAFTGVLANRQIQISMDGKGSAPDNVFVERLWRSLKYELIYLHSWPDGFQLEKGLRQYLHFYNHERKHQALNNCTPAQVYLTTTQ